MNKYLLITAVLLLVGCTSKTYDKCRIQTLTVERGVASTTAYSFVCNGTDNVTAQGDVIKNPIYIITNDPDHLMKIKVYQSRFVSYNMLYSVEFDNRRVGNMGIGATVL